MDRNLRIRMLLEAGDRFTKPLRDLTNGSKAADRAVAGTRDRLKDLERASADIDSFRALRSGLDRTSTELAQNRERVDQLLSSMAAVEAPTRAMTRDLARAERQLVSLERDEHNQARALQELSLRLHTAGVDTDQLGQHQRALRTDMLATNREMRQQIERAEKLAARERRIGAARARFNRAQDTAGNVAGAGVGALSAATVAAAPLVASARAAMTLEEGMAGVAKVTGMTGPQIAGMTDRLVDLSTKIPMTAAELSTIAAAAGAAGVGMDANGKALKTQAADLVAFTDAAARMGIAFDMTAEDVGDTMAKWRQAFKLTQPEVEALGDRVNALTNKFGGKAPAVAGIITRIGPLGKVAGIAAPAISALASSLNSIGVEEEIASTGIKNLLLTMTKGTAATKGQTAAFKALGLDAEKGAKAMQIDADGTIVDLLERVGKLSKDKQASLLSELFGTESVGAIAPLLTNLDGLKQRFNLVGNQSAYAGSMTQEFLSRINTTQVATDLAVNGLQAVNLALGAHLLPTVKQGAQAIGRFAIGARTWARENPALAKTLLAVAGGTAALLGTFGVLAIGAAAILGPIAFANAGLIALGVAGGVASVGLWPIIAAVLGITAAVLGVTAVFKHFDVVNRYWLGFWGGIRQSIIDAASFMSAWGPRIGRNLMDGILQMLNPATLVRRIWSIGSAAIGAFKAVLGIHSPSRVFAGLGGFMMAGLDRGLDDAARRPIANIRRVAGAMATTFAASAAIAAPRLDMEPRVSAVMAPPRPDMEPRVNAVMAPPGPDMEPRVSAVMAPPGPDMQARVSAAMAPPELDLEARASVARQALSRGTSALAQFRAADRQRSAPASPAPPAAPVTIIINAAPGQNERSIAQEVERILAERDRRASAARRSSFRDDPDGADV